MPTPHQTLLHLIGSSWIAQAVHVAASLGVADELKAGPLPCPELARQLGADEDALRRLLRALCTVELCREVEPDRFALTDTGELLQRDHPASLRSWAIWWGTQLWQDFAGLLHSVTTGESARAHRMGTQGFGHLQQDPAAAAIFHQAMVELTRLCARDAAQAFDFAARGTLVDVGGGYGEFLLTLLETFPHLRGTVFDQPHAREQAQATIRQRHLADRCTFHEGDFFQHIPPGAGLYILKSVLHDWPDDKCRLILQRCREAAGDGGRLLLVERIMPESFRPTPEHQDVARADLTMLVALGAKERTQAQFHALLRAASFKPRPAVPVGMGLSLIEAVPS